MEKLIMIKCPSCKDDFPLKRKELGYKVCIKCSTEKPKVAINTVNGEGDHIWNDILIMHQDQVAGISKRAVETGGRQKDYDYDNQD